MIAVGVFGSNIAQSETRKFRTRSKNEEDTNEHGAALVKCGDRKIHSYKGSGNKCWTLLTKAG